MIFHFETLKPIRKYPCCIQNLTCKQAYGKAFIKDFRTPASYIDFITYCSFLTCLWIFKHAFYQYAEIITPSIQYPVNADVSAVHAIKAQISKPGLPLSSYDDLSAFKIYAVDVGILRRLSHLPTTAFAENNRLFTEFKGALTESYVY